MAKSREIDREYSTFNERIRGLEKVSELPEAVEALEGEAEEAGLLEKKLQKEILEEREKLVNARSIVSEIELQYLDVLLKVGVPGVSSEDKVEINMQTWKPSIHPMGNSI